MNSGTETDSLNLEKCSVILLDVAGTTTSINFVKATLFTYVAKQAEDFLKAQWEDGTVKEAVKALKDTELDLAGATAAVKDLTEQNSENKGLKTIQGLIYKKGYEDGGLKAHVFPDVPSSLEAWAKSRKVAIYSTGSIESQKLLFSHTTEGDISSHIAKYFDQSVGPKTEAGSYEKIAKDLEVKTEEIVFVTDNSKEAEAAKSAGVMPVLVKREGNDDISEEALKAFHVVSTFKEINFENSAKRKNEDVVVAEEQPPSKLAKTDGVDDKATAVEAPTKEIIEAEEKMEVDAAVEKETEDKPSEPSSGVDKTEIESSVNKTEETTTEPEKKVEENPVEPSTEETKETVTEATDSKKTTDAVSENSSNKIEKMDVEKNTSESCTKKEGSKDNVATENKDVKSSKEEKVNEEEDNANNKTEEKVIGSEEEKAKADKVENSTGVKSNNEKAKTSAEEENITKDSEKSEELDKAEGETTEKSETDEACPKEDSEASGSDSAKPETNKEEKENKSDLANGVENGDAEKVEVVNGDSEDKLNGDNKTEDPENKVEDIKVKKIEESAESTPA
ncbi:hypothetical protein NQ315_009173, partial [Exocentrus adspersus]